MPLTTFTPEEQLAFDVLQFVQKLKSVPSTPTATYGHGPGGIFSSPALDKRLFSAALQSSAWYAVLPWLPTTYTGDLFGILTGQTATTGANSTTACGDAPVVGSLKLCSQTKYLGRHERASQVYDVTRIGETNSRSEHFDFMLMNNPYADLSVVGAAALSGSSLAQNEFAKAVTQLAIAFDRDFSTEVYTGNNALNTDGVKYMRGFDLQINTGYRDAETGTACAAADSIIASYNNAVVNTTAGTMVSLVSKIFYNLSLIAEKAKLNPVQWKIAMRPGLFFLLTEIWPCAYMTTGCSAANAFSTSQVQYSNAEGILKMRDDMRNRKYLMVNGKEIGVIEDDSIVEDSIDGVTFRSSIYIVPVTATSANYPVTYFEYFDWNKAGGVEFANLLGGGGGAGANAFYNVTDGGRYLVIRKAPTNGCMQIQAVRRLGLIMRTPYLAARITNIRYTNTMHERDSQPSSPYWVDGGNTTGYGPSYYTPTA